MLFRNSGLYGRASDAVDAVRSAIPEGFKFSEVKTMKSIEKITNTFSGNLKRST